MKVSLVVPLAVAAACSGCSKSKEIPPPRCAFADLWQQALKKGANTDKTAQIVYDITGYSFRQKDPLLSLAYDAECKPKGN